jgi:hypothetical protein
MGETVSADKKLQTAQRLQSRRRLVPSEKRKRALFSCDRCKLRKTKCNRIQNNDLKYDNITPCIQCYKAGVSCITSIPRKKRFYGPVKNIALHYKCLLALVTGIFPDSDVYNIEDLIDLGNQLKIEMPSLDSNNDDMDSEEQSRVEELKMEAKNMKIDTEDSANTVVRSEPGSSTRGVLKNSVHTAERVENSKSEHISNPSITRETESAVKPTALPEDREDQKFQDDATKHQANDTEGQVASEEVLDKKNQNLVSMKEAPKLPPNVKIRNNNSERERLIMDKFGHTHFIGNFGTASLLNGLCDIIIKRSYNQVNPPTSTQDIRDSSVQTITSENVPVYQYPKHLYNMDTINVDRFPLINIVGREEADIYVEIFFAKVHPYYLIFNQDTFKENYNIFWGELELNSTEESKNMSHTVSRLSSAEICTIYTVWILGRRFQQYSSPENLPANAVLDEEMIGNFIDIIKLSLSDVVLTPSIDGIRLLILFSVYLSSIKVRESGYCLMELAAIQAKSLGLHRKSIVNKFNDKKSDVMRRIMWSLTKAETTLCCSFGRASAIPWEEIDIDFPEISDIKDDLFKIYYLQSCSLTKIIFEILDYKKKNQKDPLSLSSIEKALYFKHKLELFWESLPESWKDYKSLPIKRYKPKLHIQYHYYYITLTLPMFLYIVNSHSYTVKNDDPFLSLLVSGIKSSFKTAEITSYTDSKGFFNGTIYYDVFYCYNAIMVLTLSYILFKTKPSTKKKQIIDLQNLNDNYGINLDEILNSINLIRKLVLNNLNRIDGTMKRMSDIIETLLEDLGIIHTLVEKYGARKSNAKKIGSTKESGNTSVGSIPTGFSRIRFHYNKSEKRKRPQASSPSKLNVNNKSSVGSNSKKESQDDINFDRKLRKSNDRTRLRAQSHPPEPITFSNDADGGKPAAHANAAPSFDAGNSSSMFRSGSTNDIMPVTNRCAHHTEPLDFTSSENTVPYSPSIMQQNGFGIVNPMDPPQPLSDSSTPSDINGVLSSLSLNTDLMDALFGTDVLNLDLDSDLFS